MPCLRYTFGRRPASHQPLLQRLLRVLGAAVVSVILAFVLLPAFVVTLAAFNGRAILSFPPESWSWRWVVQAVEGEDFQGGVPHGPVGKAGGGLPPPFFGGRFAPAVSRFLFLWQRH